MNRQFLPTRKEASDISKYYNLKQLKKLLNSSTSSDRLFALKIIRKQIENVKPLKSYFILSKRFIEDSNNNCSWQALIIIGEYLRKYPDEIFGIIIEYGSSEDKDMRIAIATVLLEHLFENDFKKYFDLYKKYAKDNSYLLDTLSRCWVNESDSREQKEIKNYLKYNYTNVL